MKKYIMIFWAERPMDLRPEDIFYVFSDGDDDIDRVSVEDVECEVIEIKEKE